MKEHYVRVSAQRDGRVFVQPMSFTANGFMISDGLPEVVDGIDDAEVLGVVVTAALHTSNRRPLPARDLRNDPPDREFLAWLGVRSWSQYKRGVRSLGVLAMFDDEIAEVSLTPSRNDGPRGGFTPISEERFSITFESPEQLGRAVQDAMSKATV